MQSPTAQLFLSVGQGKGSRKIAEAKTHAMRVISAKWGWGGGCGGGSPVALGWQDCDFPSFNQEAFINPYDVSGTVLGAGDVSISGCLTQMMGRLI